MSLLMPDSGLLFWMLVIFLIVLAVLAKWGFPVITSMVDKRRKYIDSSLEAAGEARRRLDGLEAEMDGMRQEARKERNEILKSAADAREKILSEARQRAGEEGERIIAAARISARNEGEAIVRDARRQVAMLSIAVSEKVLRGRLEDERAQTELVEKLISEIEQKGKVSDKEA